MKAVTSGLEKEARVLGQESPFGSHGNTLHNTEKVPVCTVVCC